MAETPGAYRARNFCFTAFEYESDWERDLKTWDLVKYYSVGYEVCPKTDRHHLQGYIEFTEPVLASTFWNRLRTKCWCQARKKAALASQRYTQKGGNYEEFGAPSHQGKSDALVEFSSKLKSGVTMKQCALDDPPTYIKNNRGIEKWYSLCCVPRRNEVPDVTVVYGSTGSGKSRYAREQTSEERYVWHPQQGTWFDGYYGQKEIIMEEFRGQIPLGMLLSLLDRYDSKVQSKGGMMEFNSTKIIITSPTHPDQWYKEDPLDDLQQLERRLTRLLNFPLTEE